MAGGINQARELIRHSVQECLVPDVASIKGLAESKRNAAGVGRASW